MTNEEAIEVIEQDIPCEHDTDLIEALNMAIAALKAEPCEDAVKREAVLNTLDAMDAALDENRTVEAYKELLKECFKELPPVTPKSTECEDAISRRAMLDGLASIAKAKAKSDAQKALMGRVMFFTEKLPPVTPKQRWIHVSEGQPKESGEYLVSVIDEYDENYEAVGVARYDAEEGEWQDLGVDRTVIAWNHKPAPYKEGVSEWKQNMN